MFIKPLQQPHRYLTIIHHFRCERIQRRIGTQNIFCQPKITNFRMKINKVSSSYVGYAQFRPDSNKYKKKTQENA